MNPERIAALLAFLTLLGSGLVGWVSLESRVSGMEKQIEDMIATRDTLATEMIEAIKEIHELKGKHETHSERRE